MKISYSAQTLTNILPIITKANLSLLSSGTFYLAQNPDQSIIGCGGWTKEKPGTREIKIGVGHIRHFATHPQWLNQSVGRKIYEACEQQARANQISCLECFSSLNAEGFYQALGFKTIKHIIFPLIDNQEMTTVLMRKIL